MEDLLQEIKKNFPVMEQYQEEFDTLKKMFERELNKMFDIEDLEKKSKKNNHQLDLSLNDTSNNTHNIQEKSDIIYRDHPLIKYYNPFYFLYQSIPNNRKQIWKKKLRFYYRKILLQCHPDKQRQRQRHNKNRTVLSRKECHFFLHQSKKAYKKEKYGIILYIANITGIKIHELSQSEFDRLKIELEEITNHISTIQNSFPWLWKYQPWTRNQIIEFLKKKHRLIPKKR